jgi:nitrate/nitrite transport system ATP-binding protein
MEVLRGINLEVVQGEFVAILGFSGTGKTTLTNMIAGLDTPDRARGPGPERGLVFQSYSLMPWLTVKGNVMLAVDAAFPKLSRADKRGRKPTTISAWLGWRMPQLGTPRNYQVGCGNAYRLHALWS